MAPSRLRYGQFCSLPFSYHTAVIVDLEKEGMSYWTETGNILKHNG